MAGTSPHIGADYRVARPELDIRNDQLHAVPFDDGYYSAEDGLAETRHVFLAGNDLVHRMAATDHLVIAETGFGTGLNCLAVMAEMDKHPNLHIDYISVEGYPLGADTMRHAHASFPAIASHAAKLCQAMPPRWPGYHLIPLLGGRMSLHLHYGLVDEVLPELDFSADAWFLDGFAPARNPAMWSPDIMGHVGRLTRQGGTLASFTAAGSVRRGLEAAGFTIQKSAGYGRKRDMIIGRKGSGVDGPHSDAQNPVGGRGRPPGKIAVIGGGIAGAAVAAGLTRRGAAVHILDSAPGLAAGASGNRMALQSPKLTVDHNAASRLSAACLGYAARCADLHDATVACGVMALDAPERLAERHAVFRQQCWPGSLLRTAGAGDAAAVGLSADFGGLFYETGRVIAPEKLVRGLAVGADFHGGFAVSDVANSDGGVQVTAADGRQLACDAVVLAGGAGLDALVERVGHKLPLQVTRGEVSHVPQTKESASLSCGMSFGGYLTPAQDGLHELGATFSHDLAGDLDTGRDGSAHAHNFGLLPESMAHLFAAVDHATLSSRVGYRASMPDRRPVSGRLAASVFILGGLGARGFTLAPLLGDLLAASILGRPVCLPQAQRRAVDIARYLSR